MTLNSQDNGLFTIPLTSGSETVGSFFISEMLSTNGSHIQVTLDAIDQNILANPPDISQQPDEKAKLQQLNRFNYKCNYCLHLTKFKAHIIEHMLHEHKINLMQCPYVNCSKKFKDEWKLKRHLITNKDHSNQGAFKDLNDCIKQHVNVTPQKIGQFPCPLCQVDQITGDVLVLNEYDQETSISNLLNKNIDNSLYFDKYDELKEHITTNHTSFNIDNYFVCKQCGQVFLNRYKLSCHQFNVHSGKRKRRPKISNLNGANNVPQFNIQNNMVILKSYIFYEEKFSNKIWTLIINKVPHF